MKTRAAIIILVAASIPLCSFAASIAKDDIEPQKIFWGDPQMFSKPAEIDFVALVESTPEYRTLVNESLESSDARYWILMTQAQERVTRSIIRVARKRRFDLVCEKDYLEPLGIEAEDITSLVEKDLTGKPD